jgi:hypothetical protein
LALKRAVCGIYERDGVKLTSETVEGATLTLQSIDDIHGGDGLPLGVLGVGDSIPDDILKENFENATGFLVDEPGDSLDTSTTGQTTDGRLGDSLDIVTQNFAMTLGSSFPEPLSSFASARHDESVTVNA